MNYNCPACASTDVRVFYQQQNAPVHSVLIHRTRQEALDLPTGQIALGFCQNCGFIYNMAFDPDLQDYSLEYESTQAYSPTFNAFANQLATYLVDRYDLHEKNLIEIGCGQGEFLKALCALGKNYGVGFDPAFIPGRLEQTPEGQPIVIKDYYSEAYTTFRAEFIVCKMTLEHIISVADFVSTVRRSIDQRDNTIVFFQIPDVNRVLDEMAFWDIYYEHCSYFSRGSLARLFRSTGFNVIDLWRGYGDQYLMIEAHPANGAIHEPLPVEDDLDALRQQVDRFTTQVPRILQAWRDHIRQRHAAGKTVVLWGGGSKAVAFLTTLGLANEVPYAVDINPHKHGTYLAGTATEVIAPERLRDIQPDTVIVMNPIYCDEIRQQLSDLGLSPRLVAVTETPEG